MAEWCPWGGCRGLEGPAAAPPVLGEWTCSRLRMGTRVRLLVDGCWCGVFSKAVCLCGSCSSPQVSPNKPHAPSVAARTVGLAFPPLPDQRIREPGPNTSLNISVIPSHFSSSRRVSSDVSLCANVHVRPSRAITWNPSRLPGTRSVCFEAFSNSCCGCRMFASFA